MRVSIAVLFLAIEVVKSDTRSLHGPFMIASDCLVLTFFSQ